MPTYEYECTHCGHHFEISQKMTEQPLNKCPKCKHKLRRLIGPGAGIIFKGPGFYATDYRKKPKSEERATKNTDACNSCPKIDACKQKQ